MGWGKWNLKKSRKREKSDQTGEIRRKGEREEKEENDGGKAGGARFGGLMCVFDLRPASSYANTANFPFYFISGAEICDL